MLTVFLGSPTPLTLAEITRTTNLSKNKVFRILYTLEKHHYVNKDEHGAYRLGLRFLDFGQQVKEQMNLLEASQPVMDWLVDQTNETIFLGVVEGTVALCVDARESSQSIRLFARVGRRAPLYAGGVPKLLLAFMPEERRDVLLDKIELKPITPHTITDRQVLMAELDRIRSQGYVVAADDLDEGAHSVAVPIRDHTGAVVAAISVAGPSHRFTSERIEQFLSLVQAGATRISRALGYLSPSLGESDLQIPASKPASTRQIVTS